MPASLKAAMALSMQNAMDCASLRQGITTETSRASCSVIITRPSAFEGGSFHQFPVFSIADFYTQNFLHPRLSQYRQRCALNPLNGLGIPLAVQTLNPPHSGAVDKVSRSFSI